MHSHTSQSCRSSFLTAFPRQKRGQTDLEGETAFLVSYHGNTSLVSLGHLPLGLAPASW